MLFMGLFGASPALAQRVQGSGSTFAYPIISAWTKSFLEFRQGGSDFVNDELGVDYEPIGSLGGIMRLAQPDSTLQPVTRPCRPMSWRSAISPSFLLSSAGWLRSSILTVCNPAS